VAHDHDVETRMKFGSLWGDQSMAGASLGAAAAACQQWVTLQRQGRDGIVPIDSKVGQVAGLVVCVDPRAIAPKRGFLVGFDSVMTRPSPGAL
jgi:hypothetical protein